MFKGKNVIGIVTEFNPFHEGHRYLIDSIRLRYGDCYVVAAMSGDFVQRGEPAIFDKYERCRDALRNGVDMVVQIPEIFSTSSAEDFAAGGVATLRSLSFVDVILFGSESGDVESLMRVAELEMDSGSRENAKLNAAIRDNVVAGMSYAKARAEAISLVLSGDDEKAFEKMLDSVCCEKEDSGDLKTVPPGDRHCDKSVRNEGSEGDKRRESVLQLKPNDILGVEYIKAVKRQGQCFRIDCIRRNQKFESAHNIRDAIKSGDWTSYVRDPYRYRDETVEKPKGNSCGGNGLFSDDGDSCEEISDNRENQGAYMTVDMLSDMLSYRLLQLYYLDRMDPGQPTAFLEYLDVSREIADALRKQIHEKMTFSERIQAIKSKNYTYTRISRALLHILLDIHKKDSQVLRGRFFGEGDIMPYVRVLGVRKSSRDMLSEIKTTVVVSVAKYIKELMSVRRRETIETPEELILSINASHAEVMFNCDLYAADIYNQVYRGGSGNEFTQKFIITD